MTINFFAGVAVGGLGAIVYALFLGQLRTYARRRACRALEQQQRDWTAGATFDGNLSS